MKTWVKYSLMVGTAFFLPIILSGRGDIFVSVGWLVLFFAINRIATKGK